MVGFTILAYDASKNNQMMTMIIYAALALLFQPFVKIALGRELWNVVDVVLGVLLIISIFLKPKAVQKM